MPENKRQHYVPKYYLRYFSNNNDKKSIGIFSKNEQTYIKTSSIKNQAYGDYFYSRDKTVEKTLQISETEISRIHQDIIKGRKLPTRDTEDYFSLIVSILLQYARTERTYKQINSYFDKFMQSLLKSNLKHSEEYKSKFPNVTEEQINDLHITYEHASVLNISEFINSVPIIYDLGCKLIINKSKIPFITSDHPVIIYNQFLTEKNYPNPVTGFSALGLQFFYPLSPESLLVLYDKSIYSIGLSKYEECYLTGNKSVNSLNILQIINSESVCYFNEKILNEYLSELFNEAKQYFLDDRVEFKELPSKKTLKSYMSFVKKDFKYKLELDFVKYKAHTKKIKLSFPAERKTCSKLTFKDLRKIFEPEYRDNMEGN